MDVVTRTAQSVRFWAIAMSLSALLIMALPRAAEASCGPCGAAACMFNNSCYGQYSTWCYNNVPFSCQYLGGPCPQVVKESGQCTP
jgi:hypothetical protein